MLVKPCEIIEVIEKIAPVSIAADWDHSGVQVAALRDDVTQVAVMLDPTLERLERAVQGGAEFIVTHHPLTMSPRFPDARDEYLRVLSLLLKHDVWLYSAHTSLDASPYGTARWLSEELELSRLSVLEPVPAPPDILGVDENSLPPEFGFGFVGALPKPLSYADFCSRMSIAVGRGEWTGCGRRPEVVFRVACCPGSGGSLMRLAAASGADVYITGDVKYHAALEALSHKLRVLDVGHFVLEEEMTRRFAKQLEASLGVRVWFSPSRDPLAVEHVAQTIS
jgi:dinuclear metal center YbgI/SA1388 family protein